MAIKVNGTTVVDNERKGEFNVTNPGQFTTAERDALTPVTGDTIFNTDEGELQVWDGAEWASGGGGGSGLAPAVNSATLSEDDITAPRFTNQTFTTEVEMVQEGQPVSTKSIKGKVTADFPIYPSTNPINSGVTHDATIDYLQQATSNNVAYFNYQNAYGYVWTMYDPEAKRVKSYNYQSSTSANDYDIYGGTSDVLAFPTIITNQSGIELSSGTSVQVNREGTYANFPQSFRYSGSLDIDNFLKGTSYYMNNYLVLSTTKYDYRLYYDEIKRSPKGADNFSDKMYYDQQYSSWRLIKGIETTPDAIVLQWPDASDSNTYSRVCTLTDAKSDALNWTNGSSLNSDFRPNIRCSDSGALVYHKGATFFARAGVIYKLPDGANSFVSCSVPPIPSGNYSNTAYPTLWEEPMGDLVVRWGVWNQNTQSTEFYYYNSKNSASTWLPDFYPSIKKGDQQAPYSGYVLSEFFGEDVYMYGRRLALVRQDNVWSGSYSSIIAAAYVISKYYVTVNDGADLNQLQIGDVVKTSSIDDPTKFFKIQGITLNGNSTTSFDLEGFGVPLEGDTLQAVNSTGNAPLSKWLIIDATGNVASMSNDEPEYQALGPSTTVPITFPSQFPTGTTPDEELPDGTSLQTFIKTENDTGSSEAVSNIIVPTDATIPDTTNIKLMTNPHNWTAEQPFHWCQLRDDSDTRIEIADADVDNTVRSFNYWKNKTVGEKGWYFYKNLNDNESYSYSNMEFKFVDCKNLRLKVGWYMPAYGDYIQYNYLYLETDDPNISTLQDQASGSTNDIRSGEFSYQILNDGEFTVNFALRWGGRSPSQSRSASSYLTYWRLEDFEGNEVGTYGDQS